MAPCQPVERHQFSAVDEVPLGSKDSADCRNLPGEHSPVKLGLGVLAEQLDSVLFFDAASGHLRCLPELGRAALGTLVADRSFRTPVNGPQGSTTVRSGGE